MSNSHAHVLAYVNPFDKVVREARALHGTRLGETLKKLGISDTFKINAWVGNRPVDRNHKLKANEICIVKVVPKVDLLGKSFSRSASLAPDMTSTNAWGKGASTSRGWASNLGGLLPYVGGAVGVAGLLGGMFFGKTATQRDVVNSPFVTEPDPEINYNYPDEGGAAYSLIGSVAGVSNQENPWGELTCIFGSPRVFPVKGMISYSVPSGNNIVQYGCLDLGYGQLDIDPATIKIGSRNISEFAGNLTYEIQYGKADDAPFTIPLADVADTPLSIPMVAGQAKTVEAGAAKTQISLEFELPRGLWHTNIFYPTVKQVHTVSFGVYYKLKADASYTAAGSLVVTDLIETYKRLSFSFNVPAEGVYDVQVVPDGTGTFPYGVYNSGEASANWIGLKAYGDSGYPFKPIYDSNGDVVYCSRIAIQATQTSDNQGATEDFSLIASRLLRHWNGTTWDAPAKTSNPADEILECLTGQANWQPVPEANIDLPSFLDFYNYCETNGFQYDKVVDQGVSLKALIDEIAACGNACVVDINGKHTVIIDRPTEVITQHFTLNSIIADSFIAQASLGKSPTVIFAQYLNPNSDWQQDEIEVYEDGYTKETALLPQTILFPGVTSSTAAHYRARRLMAYTRLQFWTYTFRVPSSYLVCKYGDRVKVTHDAIFAGLGQGRISRLITNEDGDLIAIRLNASQTIEAGKVYGLRTLADVGSELHLQLDTAIGDTQEFTLATPLASDAPVWPVVGHQAQFGELNEESIDCRITEITPADDFTAQITCVDYNEAIYTSDTQPIPEYTSRISIARNSRPDVAVPTLQAIESGTSALVSTGTGVMSSILMTLEPQPYPVTKFEVQYRLTGTPGWTRSPESSSENPQVRILGVVDRSSYDIQVRARRHDNYGSAWAMLATGHVVVGKTQPPPDVPGTVYKIPYTTTIGWFYDIEHGITVPLDFAGFIIKMAWGTNKNWDQGVLLSEVHRGTQYNLGGLAKGQKTIMIKAVDDTGNEQAGPPAYISVDFGDVIDDNLLEVLPVTSAWPGITIENATWDGTTVKADDDGELWWGDDLNAPWFPDPLSADWFDTNYKQVKIRFSYTPPTYERKPFRVRLEGVYEGSYKIEYKLYGQAPWFDDPLDADWFPEPLDAPWFDELPSQLLPMPDDGIEGDWQRFDFEITLFAGARQGTAGGLSIVLDVPDILEYINDFVVDNPAGKRCPLTFTYRSIENVKVDLETRPAYPDADKALRHDKDISGPLIQIVDSAGDGTTGLVDVTIKGY